MQPEQARELKLILVEEFRTLLRIEQATARRILDSMEDEQGRLELARTDPETARRFEEHTRAEREQRGYEIALSAAIAHVIVFEIETAQSYFSGP